MRGRCAAKKDSARSTCATGKDMLGSRIQARHIRAGRSGSSGYAVCPSTSVELRRPIRSTDVSKAVLRPSGSWNSIWARAPAGVDERWICGRAGSAENWSAVPRYTTRRVRSSGSTSAMSSSLRTNLPSKRLSCRASSPKIRSSAGDRRVPPERKRFTEIGPPSFASRRRTSKSQERPEARGWAGASR